MHRLLPLLALLPTLLFAQAETHDGDIDLPDLFEETFERIGTYYLHPEALRPNRMLERGIQEVENVGPPVLVRPAPDDPGAFEVVAGGAARVFRADDVVDLDGVRWRLEEVVEHVVAHVQEVHDDPLEADTVRKRALEGMLRALDRHSRLVVGDRLDEFNTRFGGTLVGIGARVGRRSGEFQVLKPFPGSPAHRSGLRAGDVIAAVDGQPTQGLTVNEAVDRIRGPEGVPVVLTVRRPGESERRVFAISREKVLVPSVEAERLPDDVGYLLVDHFSQRTSQEFEEHLAELQEAGPLRGVIIDLRGNTGGSMRHSTRIVNTFVESGLLLRTEGSDRKPVPKLTPRIAADARYKRFDGPVAVLMDGSTASGSEIVAGGLKLLDRSITIGEQSYGKGTVQKLYKLREGDDPASLKLTVGRYLLPKDGYINSVGVTPDVATGQVWLDPRGVYLPDILEEPPANFGPDRPHDGIDARDNPGGGREPLRGGVNGEPVARLLYPRVLPGWGTGEAVEEAEPAQEAAELEDPPGWSATPGEAGEPLFNDVELRLAHEILKDAPADARRPQLLAAAGPVVQRWQAIQSQRMADASKARQLAWSSQAAGWMDRAPKREPGWQARMAGPPPPLAVALDVPPLVAGEEGELTLTVRNTGAQPRRHLRALLTSDLDLLDGLGFLLGDVQPGGSASWTTRVEPSLGLEGRAARWRLYLLDDDGPLGGPVRGVATLKGYGEPELQVSVKTTPEQGDDGLVLVAAISVRNGGEVPTGELSVVFGEPDVTSAERLERFASIDALEPGAVGEATLRLRVRDPAGTPMVPVRMKARDTRSGRSTTVGLELPTGSQHDTGWVSPPSFALSSPGEAPLPVGPMRLAGHVAHPSGLEYVEVFVGRDKVFSRTFSDDARPKKVPFDVSVHLTEGPARLTVRGTSGDRTSSADSSWVVAVAQP